MTKNPGKRQCPAKSKRTGQRCQMYLGPGAKVCRWHGGATKAAKAAAKRRAAEQEIADELAAVRLEALGVPVDRDVDPHDEFLRLIRESAGIVEFMRRKVQQLEQGWVGRVYAEALNDDGDAEEISEPGPGIVGPNHLGDGGTHIYVQMYNEERDRLAKYCKLAIDAGIAERQVRIAQTYAEQLAQLIRGLLADLGVPGNAETLGIVRKHLTMYAGGAAA